jgi:hypothetical protein
LDITYNNDDWEHVQNECLRYIDDENLDVAQLAIICLGHIFTFHGLIDKEKVLPILYEKMKEQEMTGIVEDALDDMGVSYK